MLTITIPGDEQWNEATQEFVTTDLCVLQLEHSLVSVSKWEEIFEKPFLNEDRKSTEEVLTYIQCMSLNGEISKEVFAKLDDSMVDKINTHINAKMTATWFSDATKKEHAAETITAEVVYYWMFTMGIPKECETWHFNKLLTLIKIFSAKYAPKEKLSPAELAARNRELNAQRRKALATTG
jgi:hypothetical protein